MADSRLHKRFMQQLIGELLADPAAAAERVLREVELAEEFDVSRGVIRETLRGLEERGVVVVRHGRGATVTPQERWDVLDPDVLAAMLDSDARADLLVELIDCRRVLETEAAAQAAERSTDADIAALREAAARTEAAASTSATSREAEARFLESDIAFHRAVMDAARNRVLSRMTESIQRALISTWPSFTDQRSRPARVVEHAKVVEAIADRDPEAARAVMLQHLIGVEQTLLAHVEAERSADAQPAAV